MRIIAADDEELALSMLVESIEAVQPQAEIHAFQEVSRLIAFARETPCDIAFLDIEMRGQNGLQIAKALKELHPNINIIFVTGYSGYMGEAFSLHASGYVLKPATKEAVQKEIENLRHPLEKRADTRLYVQTFGNFEVLKDGLPLQFSRTKAKELFAYLVSRRGAGCGNAEIAAVLWEERDDSRALQSHLRNLVSDLTQTLRSAGAGDVLQKSRGILSVLTEKLDCDFYDFCRGDIAAVNSYTGEFMTQYSWAEFTNGYLERRFEAQPV